MDAPITSRAIASGPASVLFMYRCVVAPYAYAVRLPTILPTPSGVETNRAGSLIGVRCVTCRNGSMEFLKRRLVASQIFTKVGPFALAVISVKRRAIGDVTRKYLLVFVGSVGSGIMLSDQNVFRHMNVVF